MIIVRNNIITGIIALISGLGIGYLLFYQPNTSMEHEHTEEVSETIWTCSMHPQVRQEEPGLCPICEMDLIPMGKQKDKSDPTVYEMTPQAVRLADIETTVVGQAKDVQNRVRLNGKLEIDETRMATQVSDLAGEIEAISISYVGQEVKKGQKIAVLYIPELVDAQQDYLEATKINPELAQAARQKLQYLKVPEEVIKKLENEQQVTEKITIYADFSGIVTALNVNVGDYVKVGQPLYRLADLSRLWAVFEAYERDLGQLQKGAVITFTTPGMEPKVFKTHISYIDPLLDAQTRTVAVRAEVLNSSGQLKPEMLIRGEITAAIKKGQALKVPKTAVLWTGKRSVVYVKIPNMKVPSFQFREIELGDFAGTSYSVISGLEAGEEVVTKGAFVIDAAAQLNNQQSMMNRNVGIKGGKTEALPDYSAVGNKAFFQAFRELTDTYMQLKDALVSTDLAKASDAGTAMQQEVTNGALNTISGDPAIFYEEKMETIKSHLLRLLATTDVENQREEFDWISQQMITLVKVFGMEGQTIYLQYCPMAFEDQGADWLSYEAEIMNPYFGDRMLRCGLVKETFE